MSTTPEEYTLEILRKVATWNNKLDSHFAYDILSKDSPFAYLDEIIQRGYLNQDKTWIASKHLTGEILLNHKAEVDRYLQNLIDRGKIRDTYAIVNDARTIIQFIHKKRCLDWYKKILRACGVL